jgi:hypothetical protein
VFTGNNGLIPLIPRADRVIAIEGILWSLHPDDTGVSGDLNPSVVHAGTIIFDYLLFGPTEVSEKM